MGEKSLAQIVEGFMVADKTMAGIGTWQHVGNAGEHRISWPLLVRGELSGHRLAVVYQVGKKPMEFNIGVYAPRAVWRLDYEPHGGHPNRFGRPAHLPSLINGSHVHRWSDNRHLCIAESLPLKLKFADELPANIRSYENAFRWACSELKIQCKNVVDPPMPDKFL